MRAVQCSVCKRTQAVQVADPIPSRTEWEAKRDRWFLIEKTGQVVCGGSPCPTGLYDSCLAYVDPIAKGEGIAVFIPGLSGGIPKGVATIDLPDP